LVFYAKLARLFGQPRPAMLDNTTAAFSFPAIARKKVTAAFDGGRIAWDR